VGNLPFVDNMDVGMHGQDLTADLPFSRDAGRRNDAKHRNGIVDEIDLNTNSITGGTVANGTTGGWTCEVRLKDRRTSDQSRDDQ
jgi:hypothetical protein